MPTDIVTLTANPSIDRTVTITAPLAPGGVHRIATDLRQPGGKGINVARVAAEAGLDVAAIIPLGPDDPLEHLVDLPLRVRRISQCVRTNIAIVDTAGETTKINEAGPTLSAEQSRDLISDMVTAAQSARCVVLAGSLPHGVGQDFYVHAIREIRAANPEVLIALDTSDAPLMRVGQALPAAAPDLIKPNATELAQLSGRDPQEIEAQVQAGDLEAVIAAARDLTERGIGTVLATLGGAGALLVTATHAWHATSPDVEVKSTVGAGDASLAGFLIARLRGEDLPTCLRYACAYGAAAAAMPGTGHPRPQAVHPDHSHLTPCF